MSLDFPGKSIMIQRLNAAVSGECPHEITRCLRQTLVELMDHDKVRLPTCVHQPAGDHYARRELHRDPVHGYSMLAMTWGPGQSTPVHDHAGMWCVEAVWSGQIEVVQYELTESRPPLHKLEPRTTMRAGVGSAGSLIPPHEYHTISNPLNDRCAVTVHIYSGDMNQCGVFRPADEPGWFRREDCRLYLDAA